MADEQPNATFPWTLEEAGVDPFNPHPEGIPSVDIVPELIEALKDARGWLQIAAEYGGVPGRIGNPKAFLEPVEKINAALKKAGVE